MNTFTLQEFGLDKRVPPRPKEQRQCDYEGQYDNSTLFYDVFYAAGKLIFLGPPVDEKSLKEVFDNLLINNKKINRVKHDLYRSNKVYKVIVSLKKEPELSLFGREISNLVRNIEGISDKKRILYTTQKNNNIDWIVDWVSWHIKYHRIDAVVIYDNNSDQYNCGTLDKKLSHLSCHVSILSMPFLYGPGAYKNSSWDSDYYQYFAFEHVRYMFCQSGVKLLNMDIDELVVTNENHTIFDFVDSEISVVFFSGYWVDVDDSSIEETVSHGSHSLLDISNRCSNKWLAIPKNVPDRVFLRVHDTCGKKIDVKKQIVDVKAKYFHFRSISTDWKWVRSIKVGKDAEKHRVFNLDKYNELFKIIPH